MQMLSQAVFFFHKISQNNLRDSIVSKLGSLKVVEFGEHKAL